MLAKIRKRLTSQVLRFKYRLGYDPGEDDKLPRDVLVTDPAKHFRTWSRNLPKGNNNQAEFD